MIQFVLVLYQILLMLGLDGEANELIEWDMRGHRSFCEAHTEVTACLMGTNVK